MDCFPANPTGWDGVIHLLPELLTKRNLKRLVNYCNAGNKHFECNWDYQILVHWKSTYVGLIKYRKILYGVNSLFKHKKDEEEEESDYLDDTGGEYFLAFHQWNAYKEWLSFHPAEEESFCRFEVCSHLFNCESIVCNE
jgi:hypothetical protein